MAQGEGLLRIHGQIQIADGVVGQLVHLESIVAVEKIRLVQTMLPQQRGAGNAIERRSGNGLECAEIGAL